MSRKAFVSPHVHVKSLDSASTPEAFAKREEELGTGYLTVTDHGSLEATREVYDLCHGKYKGKLVPILGNEAYFRDDNCGILDAAGVPKDKAGLYKEHIKYCHLTLHTMDEPAFNALVKAVSDADFRAEKHGSERKPLFDWKVLESLGGHNITGTSGCLIGMVGRHLVKNQDPRTAIKYYEKLRSCFKPGNFYVEVFPHICDKYWESNVTVTYEDGTEEKIATWKNLKTLNGEIEASDLASSWARNPKAAAKKHGMIVEIKQNRKWTPHEEKVVAAVQLKEGFLTNECRPWAPDGDYQVGVNKFLISLAKKYGDPILVSDDSHFAYPDEKIIQDARLAQHGGNWKFANSYHRMSSDEAWEYFRDRMGVPEAMFEKWVETSRNWAARFHDFKFTPRQTLPTRFYPEDTLGHTMGLIKKHGRMDWKNPQYVERLRAEIKLLHQNGTVDLLPYFMIDEEVCDLYVRNGKITGPGRGSAAGVLLPYLLEITHVDPLKYKLSLDRFLTLDRIQTGKYPDIDQDLPSRDLLVNPEDSSKGWLAERFGDCVAQMSTDTTMKLKSSIKDVDRFIHGKVRPEIDAICGQLPVPPQGINDHDFVFGYQDSGGEIPGILETDPTLQNYVKYNPREWDMVQKALGLTRQKGRHPCGFLISNSAIDSFIPMTSVGGVRVTQFTAPAVEAMGGLKIDFLVVNALNDIDSALTLIRKNRAPELAAVDAGAVVPKLDIGGKKVPVVYCVPNPAGGYVNIWDLPEDPAVFKDICEGDVVTVFQLDAPAARQGLHHFKPGEDGSLPLNSIEALSAFTALDRKGPLDAYVTAADGSKHNMLTEYAHRARGMVAIGDLPVLNTLLPETHGIIVYQEQLQYIFQEVGGSTPIEANNFRLRTSKKKMAEVDAKDYPIFMKGAVPKMGEEAATVLWGQMKTFAEYGFNKSHAVSYMFISYAEAWLKHYYPLEWWCAVLRNADRAEVDEKYWKYCGHMIKMPDIQLSQENFCVEGDSIRAPLWLLGGIGEKAREQIAAGIPYADIRDFVNKIEVWKDSHPRELKIRKPEPGGPTTKQGRGLSAINDTMLKNLVVCGIMDSLFPSHDADGNEMLVPDKLKALAETVASVRKKKKIPAYASEFSLSSEVSQFQAKKKLLPAFSRPLRDMGTRCAPERFKRGGKEYIDVEGEAYYCMEGEAFKAVNEGDVILPPDVYRVAVVAYVITERRFSYVKEGQDRDAIDLTLDIDGYRTNMVKFGGKGGLPSSMKEKFEGALVCCLLNKSRSSEYMFYFVGPEILAPALADKSEDESSKEESKNV